MPVFTLYFVPKPPALKYSHFFKLRPLLIIPFSLFYLGENVSKLQSAALYIRFFRDSETIIHSLQKNASSHTSTSDRKLIQ